MASLSAIEQQQRRAILRAFEQAVSAVRDQVVLQELATAIQSGRVDAAIRLLGLDRAAFEPFENAIREAYRVGGIKGAEQVGRIPVADVTGQGGTLAVRFDVHNPRAERWVQEAAVVKVVEIVAEQQSILRDVIQQGIAGGQNPRATALDIVGRIDPATRARVGGYIGLTEQQAQWINNARRELQALDPNYLTRELRDRRFDAAFQRALESGQPMTAEQIDAAIARMQARALRYRGENIARTESLNALRAGQHEAVMQAIDAGDIDRRDVMKVWHSAGDDRTRESHLEADGQRVQVDEPFMVGGEPLMYPGDPGGSAENVINCRCREEIVIDFAGSLKRIDGFGE